mgnify:CR=1 FL=1
MLAVLERRRRDPVVMPALRENNIIGVLENVISGRRRRFYGRNTSWCFKREYHFCLKDL